MKEISEEKKGGKKKKKQPTASAWNKIISTSASIISNGKAIGSSCHTNHIHDRCETFHNN